MRKVLNSQCVNATTVSRLYTTGEHTLLQVEQNVPELPSEHIVALEPYPYLLELLVRRVVQKPGGF